MVLFLILTKYSPYNKLQQQTVGVHDLDLGFVSNYLAKRLCCALPQCMHWGSQAQVRLRSYKQPLDAGSCIECYHPSLFPEKTNLKVK